MSRILVCGSRDWDDVECIECTLGGWLWVADVLIHGSARGADMIAAQFATRHVRYRRGLDVLPFPADWEKHGKGAGPIRNAQMLTEGKPDMVIAFGHGKGTDGMVAMSVAAGLPVYRITKEG